MPMIPLDLIDPNPFRNTKTYSLRPKTVEALKLSYEKNGDWDYFPVRKHPTSLGRYQSAFGEHRKQAHRELGHTEIRCKVQDLSNEQMLRMMADENLSDWDHDPVVEQETIQAVVKAYAADEIKLSKPAAKTSHNQLRFAPSYTPGGDAGSATTSHPYTLETIKHFLDWTPGKIEAALNALSLIERGLATNDTFQHLGSEQTRIIATQAREVYRQTNDTKITTAVIDELASGMRLSSGTSKGGKSTIGDVTTRNAKAKTDEMLGKHLRDEHKKNTPPPDINEGLLKLLKTTNVFFEFEKQWDQIIEEQNQLTGDNKDAAVRCLDRVATTATELLARFKMNRTDADLSKTRPGTNLTLIEGDYRVIS